MWMHQLWSWTFLRVWPGKQELEAANLYGFCREFIRPNCVKQGMQTSFMIKHVQKSMKKFCICAPNSKELVLRVTQVTQAVTRCDVWARTKQWGLSLLKGQGCDMCTSGDAWWTHHSQITKSIHAFISLDFGSKFSDLRLHFSLGVGFSSSLTTFQLLTWQNRTVLFRHPFSGRALLKSHEDSCLFWIWRNSAFPISLPGEAEFLSTGVGTKLKRHRRDKAAQCCKWKPAPWERCSEFRLEAQRGWKTSLVGEEGEERRNAICE